MIESSSVSLARLIEQNLCEKFEMFDFWPKAKLEKNTEVVRVSNEIPFPVFNCVVKSNFKSVDAEERIASILNSYIKLNVPCCWYVSPSSKPINLSAILESKGLFLAEQASGMYINDLGERDFNSRSSLSVREVNTSELLHDWVNTFKLGYELPDAVCLGFSEYYNLLGFSIDAKVKSFIGYFNSKPVCTGTLFLGSASAGIYNISTIPEARGRGFAGAMTSSILREIQRLGKSRCVLVTPNNNVELYSRIGFEKVCNLSYYVLVPKQ